uniref:Zinc finger CCHC domain-containing protein 17 n=1 Tax=Oreochromis aureus TaxID=47969 RepID=A0A668SUP9_OREAU
MSDRDRRTSEPAGLDGLPPLYSIAKGEVVSVQTYGAFVRLPGYRKEGLVHVSEMSASRVESASEIVDVGEHVWIKVIGREIQGDKVKLSFSMKAVNQGTGRDLDPNNVMAEQDSRRRKQFRDQTSNRITLEAVLNTTCSKCGCKGEVTLQRTVSLLLACSTLSCLKRTMKSQSSNHLQLHKIKIQTKRRKRRKRKQRRRVRRGRGRSLRATAAAAVNVNPRGGDKNMSVTETTRRRRDTKSTNRTNTAETHTGGKWLAAD